MAARTLPNLGLKAFFSFGEDGWNDEVDQNFLKLSVVTQGGAIDVVTTKPVSPVEGAVYVMSASAANNPNTIAVFDAGGWKHFSPNAGWTIYNRSDDSYLIWVGTEWRSMSLPNLRGLGSLNSTAGLVEQTGPATFTKRPLGANTDADVLTRLAADGRYALTGHSHPVSGVSAFNTRTGSVTLTQTDIYNALGFLPASSNPLLTGLSALGSSTGIIEQTGASSFAKRNIGVGNASDIPTVALADARYQTANTTLSALAGLAPTSYGVVEQFGNRTFRVRSIGSTNTTDLLTKGSADSLYIAKASFRLGDLSDIPDSYAGKANQSLFVTSSENALEFRPAGQVVVRDLIVSTVLQLTDAGSRLRAVSPITVTVPTDADVPHAIGTTIVIYRATNGVVDIQPDDGVTVDVITGGLPQISARNGSVILLKYASNAWHLSGDVAKETASVTPSVFHGVWDDSATWNDTQLWSDN